MPERRQHASAEPGLTLVFGASGALGAAVALHLEQAGMTVVRMTRQDAPTGDGHRWLSTAGSGWSRRLAPIPVRGAVWAGGANVANSLSDGSVALAEMYTANVLYVSDTLADLLTAGCLAPGSSLVVLGSVWHALARGRKSAYIASKAAVSGFVRAASVDLGPQGIRVNALHPGVIDTPMTHANLSQQQVEAVVAGTPLGRLVSAAEVASATQFLLEAGSSGITGCDLVVDGGWSYTRAL